MKHIKTYEEHKEKTHVEDKKVEYVPFEDDHESYKNEEEKKKKKKKGEIGKVDVMPNRVKDKVSFQSKY